MAKDPTQSRRWWKEATSYQIWPASFKDSNEDGYGDIPGITSKLEYLKNLGVDLLWLSPVYDSPQHDMGYDVRDYEKVWSKYGTMQDMDYLIAGLKSRSMRIIMDLVVNHTSNEHRWFLQSRKSRDNSVSDWYIWRDPKFRDANGTPHPPNNWRAAFGGSVWTYAEERQQYYLHLALPEQPDLNWQNEATRKAIYESAIEFWLKKGIDGFRVDVANFYWKDPSFPDAKVVIEGSDLQPMEPQHVINGPRMHEWLQEQRKVALDEYGEDIVMVGELPGTGTEEVMRYISPRNRELDTIFDMDIFMTGNDWNAPLHEFKRSSLPKIKDALVKTQGFMKEGQGWPTTFLENHDNSRSVSRFGPGEGGHHAAAAKMLAMLTATLSGTLFLYQGQEIGMSNLPSSWTREDFKDRSIIRYLEEIDGKYPNDQAMQQKALEAARKWSRDNSRTPVQWSKEANAGFSDTKPWIRANDNYHNINVDDQIGHSGSIFQFWKKVLRLRKQYKDVFIYGDFTLLDRDDPKTLSFVKMSDGDDCKTKAFVTLNFSETQSPIIFRNELDRKQLKLLLSTSGDQKSDDDVLSPWEGRIYITE